MPTSIETKKESKTLVQILLMRRICSLHDCPRSMKPIYSKGMQLFKKIIMLLLFQGGWPINTDHLWRKLQKPPKKLLGCCNGKIVISKQ